jgi:hypothetical protein
MDYKCKECGEEFQSRKSFHHHLKAHSLRIGDYYVKHYKKHDLFTKNLLAFKSYDQYFREDFNSFDNYLSWLDCNDSFTTEPYVIEKAKQRFEEKNISISPPNLYYQLSEMADINNYKKIFGSYSFFLKKLSIDQWFNKKIPENFWNQNCDELKIFIDTREKNPIIYKNSLQQKLDFGDYTAGGDFYTKTFIDRKAQDDFRQTFGKDIDRFRREMDRCVKFNCYMFVVVESSIDKIEQDNETSNFKSNLGFVWHNLRNLIIDYPKNLQIIFASSRSGATKIIPKILYYGDQLWNVDLQYYIDNKIHGMAKRKTKIST